MLQALMKVDLLQLSFNLSKSVWRVSQIIRHWLTGTSFLLFTSLLFIFMYLMQFFNTEYSRTVILICLGVPKQLPSFCTFVFPLTNPAKCCLLRLLEGLSKAYTCWAQLTESCAWGFINFCRLLFFLVNWVGPNRVEKNKCVPSLKLQMFKTTNKYFSFELKITIHYLTLKTGKNLIFHLGKYTIKYIT